MTRLPTTEKKLLALKGEIQELLALAAPAVITDYITALARPDNDIEDLRKGAEFMVKVLGISAEKDSNAGLPTFNFTIGAPMAAPQQATLVEVQATPLELGTTLFGLPPQAQEAQPEPLAAAPAQESPKHQAAPLEEATPSTLLALDPDDALSELLGDLPADMLNDEFDLPLDD